MLVQVAQRYLARDSMKLLSDKVSVRNLSMWIVQCFNLFSMDNMHPMRQEKIFESGHYYSANAGIVVLLSNNCCDLVMQMIADPLFSERILLVFGLFSTRRAVVKILGTIWRYLQSSIRRALITNKYC